ncbi:hypothetical protein BH10BAC2_BH10BAC2_20080 [soil metagenome]
MSKFKTTADGDLLLTGSGTMPNGLSGFIMKITPSTGNVVWLKSVETNTLTTGGDGTEAFYDVFSTIDSGAIVAGRGYRANSHSEMLYGKYSKNGTIEWMKKIQITNVLEDSYINSVIEIPDGSFVFAGTSYSGSYESRGIVLKQIYQVILYGQNHLEALKQLL